MIAIVGSGPSGVAAAVYLLQQGVEVYLIDGGQSLDVQTQQKLIQLNERSYDAWDRATVDSLSMDVAASAKGVQLKLAYGSDYPYRHVDTEIPRAQENIGHCTPSLAVGGFSTVWGSAMLPFMPSEISNWPVDSDELKQWYKSVLSFVPLAGKRDELEQFFPFFKDTVQNLEAGSQAQKILKGYSRHSENLNKKGLFIGNSRVAVYGEKEKRESVANFDGRNSCCYCGRCLYGCPYSLIYATTHTFPYLKSFPNFKHISGVVVEEIKEEGNTAILHGRYLGNAAEKFTLKADRVMVGAGVMSTARIMLRSLGEFDKAVYSKTSEYFLLPLFSMYRNKGVESERLHTLAQLFLECFDKNISEHSVHMQLYGYSDLYRKAFAKLLSYAPFFAPLFQQEVLSRLHVIQGYAHSSVSSSIELKLLRDAQNTLSVKGIVNPDGKKVIKKVARKLLGASLHTKLLPCLPMLSVGKPGEGRHIGGTFSMNKQPGRFETDLAGRLPGYSRTHIIDASVFPSIPASTISLTIMANAQRIAHEASRLS